MSVTFPRGFRAAGIRAGLKASGRPDLGLLVAEAPCSAAGLFTTNVFAAAPVRLSRVLLEGGTAQAVIVNSGQANAGTGVAGDRDAERATAAAADALGIDAASVLACSTGVIGEPVHMDELLAAIPALVRSLSPEGGPAFAEAILTTDTVTKEAATEAGTFRVGGCAKGVGMIAPDLATMLVFVTTDAPVPAKCLRELAVAVLEPKFESLTVDACTSTNDTVLLFASGAAGGDPVTPGSPEWGVLADAFDEVGESLLGQLAADAEGVNHVLVIDVSGAASPEDARRVAKAIAQSPLVKTAAFGGDPNPGRILQAIGSSGAAFRPDAVGARIGEVPVLVGGVIPAAYLEAGIDAACREMRNAEIAIKVSLGDGPGASRALGCDLSYDYVRINGEYTT